MKLQYTTAAKILIPCSFLALGLLFPDIGLSSLKAQAYDCTKDPGAPDTPDNQALNGNWWDQYYGEQGNTPSPGDSTVTGDSGDGGGGGGGGVYSPVGNGGRGLPGGLGTTSAPIAAADMGSGAFTYSVTDIKEPGITPLSITRCYVSTMAYNGPIGSNFDFNYNRSLELEAGV